MKNSHSELKELLETIQWEFLVMGAVGQHYSRIMTLKRSNFGFMYTIFSNTIRDEYDKT